MFRISSFVALLVVLAASSLQVILASPAFSQPVASTTGQGGQPLSVVWADNGQSPAYNAQSWGNSTLYLATGDTDTQYKLQTLHANMPPSRMSGHFKIDPTVGPNGQYYFMRMEGTNTVNNIPVMAFSARFTLNGMTGTFNSTVMQAAQGKEGPAVGSSSSSSSSSAAMSTSISSSNSGSAFPTQVATTNTSSSTSTTKSSDAGRLSNSLFTVVGAGALTALGMMAFI